MPASKPPLARGRVDRTSSSGSMSAVADGRIGAARERRENRLRAGGSCRGGRPGGTRRSRGGSGVSRGAPPRNGPVIDRCRRAARRGGRSARRSFAGTAAQAPRFERAGVFRKATPTSAAGLDRNPNRSPSSSGARCLRRFGDAPPRALVRPAFFGSPADGEQSTRSPSTLISSSCRSAMPR